MIDSNVKIQLLGVLMEIYPDEPIDNLFVRQTKSLDYELGYYNDKPLQHGAGHKFILPNELANYILKLKYDNNSAFVK